MITMQDSISYNGNNWTRIITPSRKLLELNLRELWQYRDLVFLFVRRDFVAKYKQTVLGPLWFIVQPLLTTAMFMIVFGRIAGISTDGVPNLLFYLSGIVAWNYFANNLNETSGTFINNSGIFGKVYFPRLVLPVSMTLSGLISFAIQFLLLTAFLLYYSFQGESVGITARWLWLPLLILILACQGLGFGIIVSALTSKYRDLIHLVKFGVQLWMYATPVIYPISAIPDKYAWLLFLNPVAPVIELFRRAVLGTGTIPLSWILISILSTVIILGIGVLLFTKVEKNFMDTV
jgi:lipopolysaccharide transport system permease protein